MTSDFEQRAFPSPGTRSPLIVAHRALTPAAIENTHSAILSAIEIGVDLVELDVRLSLDRHPIVLHDAFLGRTTTGRGWVRLWPGRLLGKFRVRPGIDAESIPFVAQILPLFVADTMPALHLKDRAALKPVLRLLDRLDMASRTWLWLSNPADVLLAKRQLPDLRVTLLRPNGWHPESRTAYFRDAQRAGAIGVSLPAGVLTESMMGEAHQLGLRVFTRVDPSDDVRILAAMGVDGLITSDPASTIVRLSD